MRKDFKNYFREAVKGVHDRAELMSFLRSTRGMNDPGRENNEETKADDLEFKNDELEYAVNALAQKTDDANKEEKKAKKKVKSLKKKIEKIKGELEQAKDDLAAASSEPAEEGGSEESGEKGEKEETSVKKGDIGYDPLLDEPMDFGEEEEGENSGEESEEKEEEDDGKKNESVLLGKRRVIKERARGLQNWELQMKNRLKKIGIAESERSGIRKALGLRRIDESRRPLSRRFRRA